MENYRRLPSKIRLGDDIRESDIRRKLSLPYTCLGYGVSPETGRQNKQTDEQRDGGHHY